MDFIIAERIEKIESGKSDARADEVLAMSELPLCRVVSFHCSKECLIG